MSAERAPRKVRFISLLGTHPWGKVRDLQRALLEQRIADDISDTILFVEHPPTITRGRGLQRSELHQEGGSMPLRLDQIPPGTEFFEAERGGDLTWHGPGQLLVYPILKLDGLGFAPHHDLTNYIRKLERLIIRVLEKEGLTGLQSKKDASGIWVQDRKIASIGIAVRAWTTWHGFALNLSCELQGFQSISPCGFSPDVMTRLVDFVRTGETDPELRSRIEEQIADEFFEMGQYAEVSWEHTY